MGLTAYIAYKAVFTYLNKAPGLRSRFLGVLQK
jgi:hypothetical protein